MRLAVGKKGAKASAADLGPYRKVYISMHSDARVRALGPEPPSARGLWWHLLAGEHTRMIPGVLHVSAAAFADSLEWSRESFDECLSECVSLGLVKVFEEGRLMYLPNALKWNRPQNPNVVTGWRAQWRLLPECDGLLHIWNALHKGLSGMSKAYADAFEKACKKPSPIHSWNHSPNHSPNQRTENREQRERSKDLSGAERDGAAWDTPNTPTLTSPKDPGTISEDEFARACMGEPRTRQRETAEDLFSGHYTDACTAAGQSAPRMTSTAILPFVRLVVWVERHTEQSDVRAYIRILDWLFSEQNRKWGDGTDVLGQPSRLLALNRVEEAERATRQKPKRKLNYNQRMKARMADGRLESLDWTAEKPPRLMGRLSGLYYHPETHEVLPDDQQDAAA